MQSSWQRVGSIAEQAADQFYQRLFDQNPDYRELFKGNLRRQGYMLMTMLDTAVNSMSRLEDILPAVQALGQRHVSYGVKEAGRGRGRAVMDPGTGLGDDFIPEVEAA